MIRAVSDTHASIWYLWADPRLSAATMAVFDQATSANEQIAVSSISLTEIVCLAEKRRIDPKILPLILGFFDSNELLVEFAVDRSIITSLAEIDRAQVPDRPDRIIAATAVHMGVPVISRDGKIRASAIRTTW